MDKVVVIFIICAGLAAWISYLVYNYNMNSNLHIVYKHKYDEVLKHYKLLRECVHDLINDINHKLPGSSLSYDSDENNEIIKGEIKYEQ